MQTSKASDPRVTHICERCGRAYIWVNPNVRNPVDRFWFNEEICKGRLISVNDYPFTQFHAADTPWEGRSHAAD